LNGKLNLRALPTLDEVKQRAQHTYVAPRNQIEEQLAEIWKRCLEWSALAFTTTSSSSVDTR